MPRMFSLRIVRAPFRWQACRCPFSQTMHSGFVLQSHRKGLLKTEEKQEVQGIISREIPRVRRPGSRQSTFYKACFCRRRGRCCLKRGNLPEVVFWLSSRLGRQNECFFACHVWWENWSNHCKDCSNYQKIKCFCADDPLLDGEDIGVALVVVFLSSTRGFFSGEGADKNAIEF